jgi:hypothetical protein
MGVILYPAGGAVKAQQEKIYRKQGRKRRKEGKKGRSANERELMQRAPGTRRFL